MTGLLALGKAKFCSPTRQKHISLTLRLVEHYFHSARVLVADSWFGSFACALELLAVGLYCVMNVKTCTKGYPRKELLRLMKFNRTTKQCPRETRGTWVGFSREVLVPGTGATSSITACGLNQKAPILLVDTAHGIHAGQDRVRKWTTPNAAGVDELHVLTTGTTTMHETYRSEYGLLDQINRDRQGQVSIADIWLTKTWQHRHFAEGFGFLEVAIFRHLSYFHPRYKGNPECGRPSLCHQQYRKMLAYTLLTGGQTLDVSAPNRPLAPPGVDETAPATPEGCKHQFITFHKAGGRPHENHQCAYCKNRGYTFCKPCSDTQGVTLAFCSYTTGRRCQDQHRRGKDPVHQMNNYKKRKNAPASTGTEEGNARRGARRCMVEDELDDLE